MNTEVVIGGILVMLVGPPLALLVPRRFLTGVLTLLPGNGPRVFGAVAFFVGGALMVAVGIGALP
jgi:hypothetical protein